MQKPRTSPVILQNVQGFNDMKAFYCSFFPIQFIIITVCAYFPDWSTVEMCAHFERSFALLFTWPFLHECRVDDDCDINFLSRELQAERQRFHTFEEKCKNLTLIQKKLEEDSMSKNPQNYSSLQEMLTAHQVQHIFQILYICFIPRTLFIQWFFICLINSLSFVTCLWLWQNIRRLA